MALADMLRVIMGKNRSIYIGDKNIKNIGLLGRLCQKCLKLMAAPAQTHACPGARFKRSYKSGAFFQ
jgi:hypothetical protein